MAFVQILENMKTAWESLRSRRRQRVESRKVGADAYLDVLSKTVLSKTVLSKTVTEWNSPGDEEAFRRVISAK